MQKLEFPYYEFREGRYEGRYWSANNRGVAVVATIGVGRDWGAYIGTSGAESEEECLAQVANWGAKLSEKDARHFFPMIDLPYRP